MLVKATVNNNQESTQHSGMLHYKMNRIVHKRGGECVGKTWVMLDVFCEVK